MGFWSETLDGLKDFGKTKTWKSIGMAALGASGHVLYPTLGEAIFKIDLSGWRGLGVSFVFNTITGVILRSPEYLLGTYAAEITHFWYGRLNGWVVYPVLNQYLFKFNPVSEDSALSDNLPKTEELQPGARWADVGGRRVQIFDRNDVDAESTAIKTNTTTAEPATVSGYRVAESATRQLSAPVVSGYGNSADQLRGYGNNANPLSQRVGMNDRIAVVERGRMNLSRRG